MRDFVRARREPRQSHAGSDRSRRRRRLVVRAGSAAGEREPDRSRYVSQLRDRRRLSHGPVPPLDVRSADVFPVRVAGHDFRVGTDADGRGVLRGSALAFTVSHAVLSSSTKNFR